MIILEKGEKADPLWGMATEHITDKEIDALKEGKQLYMSVNDEYAVVIKYEKEKGKCEMNNILSYAYAQISVEVLNDHCWKNCEDFEPCLYKSSYATNWEGTFIYSRHWKCQNLDRCRRLSLYLERSKAEE